MKELFNSFLTLFTECKNSIPSSRYSRLSTAGYGGNRAFPYIIYIGRYELKFDFLEPKMVLDLVFDGFFMYLRGLYHAKPQNMRIFLDFEKY